MTNDYCRVLFTIFRRLLLTGASWIFVATVVATNCGTGCEAFVGTGIPNNNNIDSKKIRIAESQAIPSFLDASSKSSSSSSSTTSLFSSQESMLLGGKLAVLQDVVKELDARHKQLLEGTNKTEKNYQQKITVFQQNLAESHKTIQGLESDLETTLAKQASEFQTWNETKDKERQTEVLKIHAETKKQIEELSKHYEDNIVGNLREKLERKEANAKDLSEKLANAEEESSRAETEKNREIEKLREQLETQTKEGSSNAAEIETLEAKIEFLTERESTTKLKDAETLYQKRIEELEANHREIVEGYKTNLQTASTDSTNKIKELKAEHKEVVEGYNAKLKEADTSYKQSLQEEGAVHRTIVEGYEAERIETDATVMELQGQVETQQKEIIYFSETNSQLEKSDSLIEELRAQIETQKKQIESAAASFSVSSERNEEAGVADQTIRDLEDKHRTIAEDYEAKLSALSSKNQKLSSDLESLVSESEEKVEIATAAVRASEKREETLRIEYEALSKEVKRNWLLARFANLSSEKVDSENNGLLRENEELWNENEALKDELLEANQIPLWRRVRSRLSRER